MVQLVFVHGVSTRKETDAQRRQYEETVNRRHEAFKRDCFVSENVTFHDPYWGKYGLIDTDLKSIPDASISVPLRIGDGLSDTELGGGMDGELDTGDLLLAAARDDFGAVINSLTIELAEDDEALASAIAAYAVDEFGNIESPGWLGEVADDAAFLERLELESAPAATAEVTLGFGDLLKKAKNKIVGAGISLIDGPFEKMARQITPKLALFLGDVFVYLRDGNRRSAIRDAVSEELVAATKAANSNNEPLIIVGHSMGANILYDMFIDADCVRDLEEKIVGEFKPDLFLTVGTQVGLLEEIDVFRSLLGTYGPAPFPACAQRWWHVFNQMDVLSFSAKGIFQGVEEFSINTKANIIDAHTAYFTSPLFHRRLRNRLVDAELIK